MGRRCPAPEGVTFATLDAALAADAAKPAYEAFAALLGAEEPGFEAWMERGWTSFGRIDDEDPLPRHRHAAAADPLTARLLFARVATGTGHGACGLAVARAARAQAPAQPAPAFLLCALLLAQGAPEAQDLLRQCLTRFPEPSPGWTRLGSVFQSLGQAPAALVCFARGTPTFALAMRRGLLAREIGHAAEARAAFAAATALNPQAPRAWFLLGTCAQDGKDPAAAAAAYRTVLALAPGIAEAAVNLGTVLQEAGDLDGARTAYRQAVRLRGDTFARVAQAMTTAPKGELWLDLGALRRALDD